jgi:hypothetical protein
MSIKQRVMTVVFGLVLLGGAFSGIAMRREDIEGLLHAHNQVEITQTVNLEKDKQRAVELIVEQKASDQAPEDREGEP